MGGTCGTTRRRCWARRSCTPQPAPSTPPCTTATMTGKRAGVEELWGGRATRASAHRPHARASIARRGRPRRVILLGGGGAPRVATHDRASKFPGMGSAGTLTAAPRAAEYATARAPRPLPGRLACGRHMPGASHAVPRALNAESCLLPVSSRPGAGSEFGVNLVLQEPAAGGTFDYHRGACPSPPAVAHRLLLKSLTAAIA